MSKKSGWTGKNTHNEIRDVDGYVPCFVHRRGTVHDRSVIGPFCPHRDFLVSL